MRPGKNNSKVEDKMIWKIDHGFRKDSHSSSLKRNRIQVVRRDKGGSLTMVSSPVVRGSK
jgi:hypothetical protein